ncbi:MAG: bifunctional pyr operon transcriptional regulator/uracil phosphoribosyltransferase PyrR [Oscillospiraceae bacterium]|nr:bifunctional pyr operon transcriptional regulator/uracil phosphoribosyltransferase PyrR [Oscillospiraceae bacterium]
MIEKVQIMDVHSIDRAVNRIAHEIIERNQGAEGLVLMGIQRRGVPLAQMIAKRISEQESRDIPVGILDITFYRDDLTLRSEHPVVNDTVINFEITGKDIVLVDDVIYTGRTIRAAIDAIMDFGRPRRIQLAVLIDRGHREFPFKADYVGKNVPTSRTEKVNVRLSAVDGVDEVTISDTVEGGKGI